MRDSSYNSYTQTKQIHSRGGEKKVMKKSLSLLLALTLVFGLFASMASAADAVAPTTAEKYKMLVDAKVLKGTTSGDPMLDSKLTRAEFATIAVAIGGLAPATSGATFTDVKASQWWYGAIEAAAKAGLVNGSGAGKFSPKADVTVEAVIKVAALLAGIKPVDGAVVEGSSAWAGPYIKAAIDAGLISARTDYKSAATRGQTIDIAYAAYVLLQGPKIVSSKVIDSKNVEVTFSDKEVVKVALTTALEANKETEITVTYKTKEYKTKVTYVVTNLEVSSVTATNLKEIAVKYSQAVDKTTAENKDAYAVTKGLGVIALDSATLQDDGVTVILVPTLALTNQATDYKIAINGVKAAAGTQVINVKDVKFTPVDAALPTLEKVESLGNKAVKLTFSEPVQLTSTVAATFKIDDKVVSGTATISGRTLIIQLFSTLTAGQHSITSNNNVTDFVNYQLVEVTKTFDVVNDTTAPTIASAKDATLESVTIVFSEDVQLAEATTAGNYLWKQGSTDKVATTVTKIDGKTYKVDFTVNKLPGYATDVFVKNVKDYSGNVIAADSKISVTAVLDQARPEVLTSVFDENNRNKLTLTFNKNIDTTSFSSSNVVVKDKDAKVVSNGYTATFSGKIVTINFSSALSAGTYTVEVSGLKDLTLLSNAMMPYTLSLTVKNTTAPVAAANVTGTLPNFIISFDKAMDTTTSASILNPDNYFITYNTATTSNITGKLPEGTNLSPTNGNKGVIITLPSGITVVSQLVVQGVKDTDGNVLSGFSKTYAAGAIVSGLIPSAAKATGVKTIAVKFNQPVGAVSYTNFTVSAGGPVTAAAVDTNDNTVVNLTLTTAIASNPSAVTVATTASALTQGITGAQLTTAGPLTVQDAIAPSFATTDADGKLLIGLNEAVEFKGTTNANGQVVVKFNENVLAKNFAVVGSNFKLYKEDGVQLTYGLDYTVNGVINGSASTATLDLATGDKLAGYNGKLRVVFDNANGNIVDATTASNFDGSEINSAAAGFDTNNAPTTSVFKVYDYQAATVSAKLGTGTAVSIAAGNSATITFNVALTASEKTAVEAALATANASFAWNAGNTVVTISATGSPAVYSADVTVTLTDAVGNSTANALLVDAN